MKKSAFLLFFSFLLVFSLELKAQSATGYAFLRTLVGARPSAMGGAFVGIQGDIHNIFYNPAGLTPILKKQGTASYLNHILDFQSGFLAYVHPFSEGTGAVALNFYDFGSFDGRDENNLPTGDFSANGLVFSAGYSRAVVKNLSVGATGKFIRFHIGDFTETALALDAGIIFSLPDQKLNIGAGVFNLGTTTSAFIETKDDLPVSLQIGASKVLEHLPVMVSAALVKFEDESLEYRFGGEITVTEQLLVRLGYNSVGQDQKVDTDKDKFSGVSFGLGFKLNTFNIDYSLTSFGEVGSLNRVTLVGRF
ncbi:MAG: PorV/PorQ family protein [Calditrichaeota bacterium]|nr:PorV/PorQ family protein [Calditrichota bacterium]